MYRAFKSLILDCARLFLRSILKRCWSLENDEVDWRGIPRLMRERRQHFCIVGPLWRQWRVLRKGQGDGRENCKKLGKKKIFRWKLVATHYCRLIKRFQRYHPAFNPFKLWRIWIEYPREHEVWKNFKMINDDRFKIDYIIQMYITII